MEVLGAGGHGTVYLLPNGNAVKGLYSRTACSEASVEFAKQKRIYDCFERLACCRHQIPFIDHLLTYLRIAKPISYSDEPSLFDHSHYACSLTMQRLHGLPLSFYLEHRRAYVESRFEPSYLQNNQNLEMMAHLALNSEVAGVYGVTFSKSRISKENPPRGYFATETDGLLNFLRTKKGFMLSDEELREMMGFVYGWIYFECRIMPVDIEFALGLNPVTKQFELNVLDFGMTFDKLALEQNPVVPRNEPFFQLYQSEMTEEEREERLLERTLQDIDLDLYVSMEEDGVAWRHFFIARTLKPCQICQIFTSLMNSESIFLCSERCLSIYNRNQ